MFRTPLLALAMPLTVSVSMTAGAHVRGRDDDFNLGIRFQLHADAGARAAEKGGCRPRRRRLSRRRTSGRVSADVSRRKRRPVAHFGKGATGTSLKPWEVMTSSAVS